MVIILHNIRSIHNVGSIFRTADAAGVEKIYLCGITPTPFDRFGALLPQFAKVALGAEGSVAWEYKKTTLGAIKELKEEGFKVYAVEQNKKSMPYYKAKVKSDSAKVALVFGNEVRGLPPSVLNAANKILEIPMVGVKESLNVSVSAGIVLYGLRY